MFLLFIISLVYAQCPINIPSSLDINWPPFLSQDTSMLNNILYLEIGIPVVQNRSNYTITFPNSLCNYPSNNNWYIIIYNCNMIFTLNETWTKYGFIEQSVNYYTLNIVMSYDETIQTTFTRYIENEISISIYLQNVITTTLTPTINTYSNSITQQINFTSQETIYVSLGNIPSFIYLQIIVNGKYLLLDENVTQWGLYNNLIMNGNSFQFTASTGNNEYDLFPGNGDYTVQVLIMSFSRRSENIATAKTIITIYSNTETPSPSKDNGNSSAYYSIIIVGVVILVISGFAINKRIKKFIYP